MTVSSHMAGSNADRTAFTAQISNLFGMLLQGARRASSKGAIVIRTLQTARMIATLSNMSDRELESIGIARSEIEQHAQTLMMKE